ncbi:hypothetical protein [Nocardia sp. NPDC047038]
MDVCCQADPLDSLDPQDNHTVVFGPALAAIDPPPLTRARASPTRLART